MRGFICENFPSSSFIRLSEHFCLSFVLRCFVGPVFNFKKQLFSIKQFKSRDVKVPPNRSVFRAMQLHGLVPSDPFLLQRLGDNYEQEGDKSQAFSYYYDVSYC